MPTPALIDEQAGTEHQLSDATIIGSAPDVDPEVQNGDATMIRIKGPDVDGVQVRIRLGDAGATVLATSEGKVWLQSSDGPMLPLSTLPVPMADGDRLRVGPRTFRYQAGPYRSGSRSQA